MTEHNPPPLDADKIYSGEVLPGKPTQMVHPGRATARTVAALIVGLVTSGALVALFEFIVEATAGTTFGDTTAAWLATTVALTGAATRLMANPAVDYYLQRLRLGTGVEVERQASVGKAESNG